MSVEDRLARLERENRRLKVAGLLVLAVIGSVFVMGQTRPAQRIAASEFVVVNASGAEVARLGTFEDDGAPRLVLLPPVANGSAMTISYRKTTHYMTPGDPSTARTEFEPSVALELWMTEPTTIWGIDLGLDLAHRQPYMRMNDEAGPVWRAP